MVITATAAALIGASVVGASAVASNAAKKQAKSAASTAQPLKAAPTIGEAQAAATQQTQQEKKKRSQTIFTQPTGLLTTPNIAGQTLYGKAKTGQ